MQIIDGNQIALEITQKIARDIFDNALDNRPGLAIILAGDREDSALYVDIKQARAKEVGIDTHLYKIEKRETTEDIMKLIKHLNQDEEVDGILVQLPLPEKYDTDKIISAIDPIKDVDCFHPDNLKKLDNYRRQKPNILSPVYATVMEVLTRISFNVTNKKSIIVANSEIFGNNLKKILKAEGSDVEVIFPDDKNLRKKIRTADLLVTAVGKRNLITGSMIKPNAVVIDVGIIKENGRIYGDVDFEEVKEMTLAITPVPGGVGPITVAKVLENVRKLSKSRKAQN
jgi:methylenetetrahydrofolate dehydrogenase (NADP+)/methenyltetrahydrofolate cyclohydrolase